MKTLVVLVLVFPLLIILLSPFRIRDKTEWPLNCQRGYFRDIVDSGLAHESGNCCPAEPRSESVCVRTFIAICCTRSGSRSPELQKCTALKRMFMFLYFLIPTCFFRLLLHALCAQPVNQLVNNCVQDNIDLLCIFFKVHILLMVRADIS